MGKTQTKEVRSPPPPPPKGEGDLAYNVGEAFDK